MNAVKRARMGKLQAGAAAARLKADIEAGIDSGDAGPLDVEQIKRNAANTFMAVASFRDAATTQHDPALMLKDAVLRHRKVLGSLNIEWIQATQVEVAIDQLITMYRDACSDRSSAFNEVERVQEALKREQLHVAELKKLNESYRESCDRLQLHYAQLRRNLRRRRKK